MRTGYVYMRGKLAGELTELSRKEYVFRYDDDYFKDTTQPSISLTLPKSRQEYKLEYLFPCFFNMLSEGNNRLVQARLLHIDEHDHFGILLAAAGSDVTGAITVKLNEDANIG
ncbi:MAG: HipA N-terminal domain-containing protein [Candidatus Symbiothrix sp.]|jgi:serine/threonine-protein kinase HipA|nr:HipA N-terminal domain-containing protein [Candidatus Symbiothrix sp.]